ncbi:MAG: divalent metal cation transporter [Bacteroidia bacterium]
MHNQQKKKSIQAKLLGFWRRLGPGLITGASDDDPSGIATYSQSGAQFGYNTLWTALITFPLMASMQEMCARIGLVTGKGLTGTLKERYPKIILWLMIIFSAPAIILNIGADIAGMGAVANMLVPTIHSGFFSVAFTLLLLLLIVYLPYKRIARIMKYLTVVLLVYIIVPFITVDDWGKVMKAVFLPEITFSKEYLSILVGILGTTISPYLFFWQTSMEVEEQQSIQKKTNIVVNNRIIANMRKDVDFGMLFCNIVMFFITLTSGSVLFKNGLHNIGTVDEAAAALQPLAGNFAYILFAMGVIGTGLLAIPVLCGSLSYIFSETFGWEEGLNKKLHEAKPFYTIVAVSLLVGLSINFSGITPFQSLLYSAILYGLTAPVIISIILHIANNRSVMGDYTNGKWSNILGGFSLFLMTAAAVALLWLEL